MSTVLLARDTVRDSIEAALRAAPILDFRRDLLHALPDLSLYLVGGAVRDAILHRPHKDYDFVARGVTREKLEAWLEAHGEVDLAGRTFGVYKFLPAGYTGREHEAIDIALPRTETSTSDTAGGIRDFDVQSDPMLPIESDLGRRDFTINALAYDLRAGMLMDPHGGCLDLGTRTLRTVGNPAERFSEDLSRLLRGIRFACELGFELESDTLAAMKLLMPGLNRRRTREDGEMEYVVPRETVGRELAKAFAASPSTAAALLEETGGMEIIFPDVHAMIRTEPAYLQPLERLLGDSSAAIAILLRCIPPGQAHAYVQSRGLGSLPARHPARVDAEAVAWIIRSLSEGPTAGSVHAMTGSAFERTFMNGRAERYRAVLKAIDLPDVVRAAADREKLIRERTGTAPGETIQSLISGTDVLNAGIEAGPRVRACLDRIRSLQLGGELHTREEALEWLKTTGQTHLSAD